MTELTNTNLRSIIAKDLMAIVIFASLARIALFFLFDFTGDLRSGDSAYYLETGHNIVNWGIHGTNEVSSFYRPPLYSLFSGIVASISETAIFFYIIQSILFLSFSVVTYFMLRRYGSKLAFLSAFLIAISPFDILMNGRVLSENLTTPLFVLGSLFFINSNNSKVRFFISGTLLGGAALSRDIYLLFPFVLLATGFLMRINWRHLACLLLGFTLLVAPWAYRNSQLPSGGVFLSKGIFWLNLWVGVWERNADWTRMPNPYVLPQEALETFDGGRSPAVVKEAHAKNDEVFFRNVTIDYVQNHPLKVVYAWTVRYPFLWFGTRSDLNNSYLIRGSPMWYFMKATFYLMNAMVVVLAMFGFWLALRSSKLPVLLCLPVIYNAVIYIPLHNVETRYTLPVMPILIIYFSFFILYARERWFSGNHVGRIES